MYRNNHVISRPRVFISYTHENENHKKWVRGLAAALVENGVEVLLDQWDLRKGQDLTIFMEEGIQWATRVLLVFTPKYRRKAEQRVSGVGYESLVITGELSKNLRSTKYIGLLRSGNWDNSVPRFLSTRNHIDFRDDEAYAQCLEELLRELHGTPKIIKPTLGINPFKGGGLKGAPPTSHPSDIKAAAVEISHKALIQEREENLCGLLARVTLRVPPTQGEWMLKLLWPSELPVRYVRNLETGEERELDGRYYKDFSLHSQRRIWPGEALDVIGPGCGSELQYAVNSKNRSFNLKEEGRGHYTLYLEDFAPVDGPIPFSQLIPH